MSWLKQIEFKVKDSFFFLFQIFLKNGSKEKPVLEGQKLKEILLLRPDRIGDTVCSFPLIDSLKKSFPQIKISIFASSKNYPLIKNDPRFDKIFIYTRNSFRDIIEVRRIRKLRFACIVDLLADDSVTTLFLSQLCSVGSYRIGLGKKKFARYYDYNYNPEPDCRDHTIDINLELMNAFESNYEIADKHAAPFIDEPAINKIGHFLDSISNDNDKNKLLIGFNLSARGENRNWGYEKSRALIARILERHENCQIVLITAPNERAKGDRLEKQFTNGVTQIPPNSNLTEASALIMKLDLLISPDTSLVHIARSLRIPVIGLYTAYKNIYRQWQPFNQEKGLVLSYGEDNIFDISVDQVFKEFTEMVQDKFPIKIKD